MKSIITTLILALLYCSIVFGQMSEGDLLDIKVDVVFLSADYLEGRKAGTAGEKLAAAYIAQRFEECGLQPKGENNWYQKFDYKPIINPHEPAPEGPGTAATNVIGFLDNQAPYTVVVGAHYDHLGYEHAGSLHAGEPAIHNGADDNASGVAALFYIAEQLQARQLNAFNYLFIAFSGEEDGLFGSKYFTNNPTLPLEQVTAMLNLDMVGHLNEERELVINGVGTSPRWVPLMEQIEDDNIKLITTESGIGGSDHTSFYLKEIPALHFFTGQTKVYHKPDDDAVLVNFEGIRKVSDYLLTLVEKMQQETDKLAYTKTKEPDRQVADFKVTLGVMPDYTFDGEGMRIDAVRSGRVADKAGIKDGDVVIKMGDMEVPDIFKYMEALAQFKKGDKTKVVILRGEEKLTKEVVFE